MNNIIRQLSEIENRSEQILSDGSARKKELTSEYEERIKQFDLDLEAETEKKISSLRQKYEASMAEQLRAQETAALVAVSKLEEHYEACHVRYVDEMFHKMTEV